MLVVQFLLQLVVQVFQMQKVGQFLFRLETAIKALLVRLLCQVVRH